MQLDLKGQAGILEALYERPARPKFAAVVCHPHPLHGGTMHNHATYRLARAVRAVGGASLRFNFRGVGRSGGEYGAGQGEVDDARTALAWLAAQESDLPRFASGFSFGAWMALRAGCDHGAVRGVLGAGLAPTTFDLDFARHCPKPVAVVQGENDSLGRIEDVRALLDGGSAPRRLWVVRGASHLFVEDLDGLQRHAESGLCWLLERT
ncbi:MAG TPA: alpha/beta hydrolase [Anaeromyxobacteraceae bacterium]|nr:alpha/beta hydrolase [Anaeromyxobacteraceae bacterium]